MKTVIYGASDDLLEIDGEFYEEYGCYDTLVTIECSDGTKATTEFDADGFWKFKDLMKGSLLEKVVPVPEEAHTDDDTKDLVGRCSEALVFTEGLEWIKVNDEKYTEKVGG